jgi:hypothetical protein
MCSVHVETISHVKDPTFTQIERCFARARNSDSISFTRSITRIRPSHPPRANNCPLITLYHTSLTPPPVRRVVVPLDKRWRHGTAAGLLRSSSRAKQDMPTWKHMDQESAFSRVTDLDMTNDLLLEHETSISTNPSYTVTRDTSPSTREQTTSTKPCWTSN